jgi:hypothetical protein
MHMWVAAEVPDKRWPFQPPIVPHTIVPQIPFLIERKVTGVETSLDLEALHHVILIRLAERFQKQLEHRLQVFSLISGEIRHGDSVELASWSAKANKLLARHPIYDKRLLALPAIEHIVQLVGRQRLMLKDIAGMMGLLEKIFPFMRVKDRSA